jgi:hypothetical protein
MRRIDWTQPIPKPERPVKVALIGAGHRSNSTYGPLWETMNPWLELVAVCDPVRDHADQYAADYGCQAFYNIRDLVKAGGIEAAIAVTPQESHASIAVFLNRNGIHCMVETPFCCLPEEARLMVETAREHGVLCRVAENFFRDPVSRFSQAVRDSGIIGPVHRIHNTGSHTGYHNCSQWIAFAQCWPEWVQAVHHTAPTVAFDSSPVRHHTQETYRAHFFLFPGNLLVSEQAANIKGFLGRQPRPGLNEWQGESGTLVQQANYSTMAGHKVYHPDGSVTDGTPGSTWPYDMELRLTEPERLGIGAGGAQGYATAVCRVVDEYDANGAWTRSLAQTPAGPVEHVNRFRPVRPVHNIQPWYGAALTDHMTDFAMAVRGLRESEYTDEDAAASLAMDILAEESARLNGKRLDFALYPELESSRIRREGTRRKLGADPLDIDAMLGLVYPDQV